jgi:hypothetical protein
MNQTPDLEILWFGDGLKTDLSKFTRPDPTIFDRNADLIKWLE